jgi:hypothetical protein
MTLLRVAPIALLFILAACETTNSSDWTGGKGTPFQQAERSCNDLLPSVEKEESRRDFFIGCMHALGWTPKPGASIDL